MYGLTVELNLSVADSIEKLRSALQKEQMGIVSEIDFQANLKERIGYELPTYKLLGICGPRFAKQIIEADRDIGALLPCSCAVYESAPGVSRIVIQHPDVVAGQSDKAEVKSAMASAVETLNRVIADLKS